MTEADSVVCRGVRGAISVETNTAEKILLETRRLLATMIRWNRIESQDVCSVFFSVTEDLDAQFPALAARQFGWYDVPLLCMNEISVPNSLPNIVRILIHWNTTKLQTEIRHVYLKEATALRPDLVDLDPADWEELDEWIENYTASTSPDES